MKLLKVKEARAPVPIAGNANGCRRW